MDTNEKRPRLLEKPIRQPIADYAKTIYEFWDKKGETPPHGFTTWMEYWEARYGNLK